MDFKIHLQEARELIRKLKLDLQQIDLTSFGGYAKAQTALLEKVEKNLDSFQIQIKTKQEINKLARNSPEVFASLPEYLKAYKK